LGPPEVLFRLNLILDQIDNPLNSTNGADVFITMPELTNTVIKVHKEFRVFAAMNFATEVGRKKIPPALLDKFLYVKMPNK